MTREECVTLNQKAAKLSNIRGRGLSKHEISLFYKFEFQGKSDYLDSLLEVDETLNQKALSSFTEIMRTINEGKKNNERNRAN